MQLDHRVSLVREEQLVRPVSLDQLASQVQLDKVDRKVVQVVQVCRDRRVHQDPVDRLVAVDQKVHQDLQDYRERLALLEQQERLVSLVRQATWVPWVRLGHKDRGVKQVHPVLLEIQATQVSLAILVLRVPEARLVFRERQDHKDPLVQLDPRDHQDLKVQLEPQDQLVLLAHQAVQVKPDLVVMSVQRDRQETLVPQDHLDWPVWMASRVQLGHEVALVHLAAPAFQAHKVLLEQRGLVVAPEIRAVQEQLEQLVCPEQKE